MHGQNDARLIGKINAELLERLEVSADTKCACCGAVPDVWVNMPLACGWCDLALCAACWQAAQTVTVFLSDDQSAEAQRDSILAAIRGARWPDYGIAAGTTIEFDVEPGEFFIDPQTGRMTRK